MMRVPVDRLGWEPFLTWRANAVAQTRAALRAWRSGENGPLIELFGGWRWAGPGADRRVALVEVLRGPPLHPRLHRALLSPDAPPREAPASVWLHLQHLATVASADPIDSTDEDALIVRCFWLALFGARVEAVQRRTWAKRTFVSRPALDRSAADRWTLWGAGERWEDLDGWASWLRPTVVGGLRYHLRQLGHPEGLVRARVDEALDRFPTWIGANDHFRRELAVRILETAGQGPTEALAARLGPAEAWTVAAGAARSEPRDATLGVLWPGLHSRRGRASMAASRLGADPMRLEAWLDLHVGIGLFGPLADAPGDGLPCRLFLDRVRRRRARARRDLRRVLLAASATDLARALCRLPALHERTLTVAGWYARDWAQLAVEGGLAFDESEEHPVTEACAVLDRPAPVPAGVLRALPTWLLKVVLRGHLGTLQRWLLSRDSSHSTAWNDLLNELPGERPEGRGAYDDVKSVLLEDLPQFLGPLAEQLQPLALAGPLGLRAAFQASLAPQWAGDIQPPTRFSRQCHAHVESALRLLEEPWIAP